MHSSPFEKFRENQKIWMAGLAIVAMVSFVIIPALMKNGDPSGRVSVDHASDVVLTSKYGTITEDQLRREMFERRMAGMFLAGIVDSKYEKMLGDADITDSRIRQQAVMKRYGYQQFNIPPEAARVRQILGGLTEDQTVGAILTERQAEELGIPVTDKMVLDFMTSLRTEYKPESDDPNAKEIPICQITSNEMDKLIASAEKSYRGFRYENVLEQVRNFLLRSRYGSTGLQQASIDSPLKRWNNYSRATRRAGVELIPVSVESYVNKIPEPTAKELEDFFEARKKKLQAQVETPEEFGFKLPQRASLQYYFINEEKLIASYKPSVTEKEIAEYYEKNKIQFPVTKLPEFSKDEKPAETKPVESNTGESKKDDAAKSEPAKSDAAKGDAPKSEPVKGDTSKSDEAKADGAKSAAGKPDAGKSAPVKTEPPKTNDKGSARERSLKVIPAAYQTKADEKKAETKADPAATSEATKADPAKTEPTKTDAAKADATKTDAVKSDPAKTDPVKTDPIAPGSNDGKPDFKLDPSKLTLTPPVEYEPLEKVRDRIITSIARERANKRRDEVMEKLRTKMFDYVNKHEDEIYELEHNKDRKTKIPPFDMDVSKEIDATIQHGEMKATSYKEFSESDLGKSTAYVEGFQNVRLADYVFTPRNGLRWFKPTRSTSLTMQYLVWKIDQLPEEDASLADPLTRDKVIHAWKFVKARELAKAEAQRLADKAKEAKKKFSELHKDSPEFPEPRVESGFSWMILRGSNQGMPELSSPTSVENAGKEFMETVFGLPEDGTGVAFNTPKDKVYAIYVTYMDKADKYQETYLVQARSEASYEPYAGINLDEQREINRSMYDSTMRRFNIDYKRPLKTGQDQDFDE